MRFAIRLSESAGFKQFISGVDRLVWFGLVDRLEPQLSVLHLAKSRAGISANDEK